MHCFFRCQEQTLRRVQEWLVRKRSSVRRAVAVVAPVADKAAVVEASPAAVVVAGWEEAVVVVSPAAEAAEGVNSSLSSGASRSRGAPFFY